MYDWSYTAGREISITSSFSCCWKDVRLKPLRLALKAAAKVCFSCCWKDVRLKQKWRIHVEREQVSVVVERMYDWSFVDSASMTISYVSVVVERMYDWSLEIRSLQKQFRVSVVVERMYDWSEISRKLRMHKLRFQLLLKGCTIEAPKPTDWKQMIFDSWFLICFSKMVDLHKKRHYFRKFGVIWVIAWLFLIVVVTSSYILSTTKSP